MVIRRTSGNVLFSAPKLLMKSDANVEYDDVRISRQESVLDDGSYLDNIGTLSDLHPTEETGTVLRRQ